MQELRDYNRSETFSLEVIQAAYSSACHVRGIPLRAGFVPSELELDNVRWIYPIWDIVADWIADGDVAAIDLGIWCLEIHEPIPFGRSIRERMVRVLGRCDLRPDQNARLGSAVVDLLLSRHCNVHYKRLVKLLIKLGLNGDLLSRFHQTHSLACVERRRLYLLEKIGWA